MRLSEMYFMLFTDTLVSNLAFNISGEMVIDAMKIFGAYDSKIIIITATIAFLFSAFINYILGRIFYRILAPAEQKTTSGISKIEKVKKSKYLLLFLMLSGLPFFGKFIILLTGFCHIRLVAVIIIATCTRFLYYCYLIIT